MQVIGEKEDGWEGRRNVGGRVEVCKGRVEGEQQGSDVVLVKDITESSAQVCCTLSAINTFVWAGIYTV